MGVNLRELSDETVLGQMKVRPKYLPCISNRSKTQTEIIATVVNQVQTSSYQEQVTTLSLNILKLYIREGVLQNNIILANRLEIILHIFQEKKGGKQQSYLINPNKYLLFLK